LAPALRFVVDSVDRDRAKCRPHSLKEPLMKRYLPVFAALAVRAAEHADESPSLHRRPNGIQNCTGAPAR
jgi:hypothetical protein